jgi:hypothetical protein
MDPAVTRMFANQFGIPLENDNLEPNDIVAAMARQSGDPLMAALLTQMASRKPVVESDESDNDHSDCQREILHLRKVIFRLKQDLESANRMARYIADIFGACPVCWGLNRLCPHCQGNGKPGYADADLTELRDWVEPALKKGGMDLTTSVQT